MKHRATKDTWQRKTKQNEIKDKEVFLYKPYNISSKSSKPKIPEPTFVQDKVNNLDKYLKYMQSPVKTMLFYPLPNYKPLWSLSQTSFSLYLHNQWTDVYKLSCTVKPQMRAICIYVGYTKATTNNWDIRSSVTVKSLFANTG